MKDFFQKDEDHLEIRLQGYRISVHRSVVTVNDGPEMPQVHVEVCEDSAPEGSLPEFGFRLLNWEFDLLRRSVEWASFVFREPHTQTDAKVQKKIFVPTKGTKDWRDLLADPVKQWRPTYSAKYLADVWEKSNGFPPEVVELFSSSGIPSFSGLELLLAFPEHGVDLPPDSRRPSQNDLFVIAKGADGNLISIMIEGKVNEPFDKTLQKWKVGMSSGKTERLRFLQDCLGLSADIPDQIRYQLLHRAASALIEAKRFNAGSAVMLIHSFSESDQWFKDYQAFLSLFGVTAAPGKLHFLKNTHGVDLYSGWVRGDCSCS